MSTLWVDLDRKPRRRRTVNRADLLAGRVLTVLVVGAAAVWLVLTL